MNNKKTLDHYLNLSWTYTVEVEMDSIHPLSPKATSGTHHERIKRNKPLYIVCVNELPGICTDAETLDEAMVLIKEAMTATFQLYMDNNEEIPEPIEKEKFKGNIAYRTNSERHYRIAKAAQRKTSSLSKVIDECIDVALGKK